MAQQDSDATSNYPAQLHHIKALYLQQRYRQCIQACRDLIRISEVTANAQPLQQAFLNFYLGLAHDELARLMHDCSHAKLPAFNQAQACYQLALDALPTAPAALEALYRQSETATLPESPLDSIPDTAPAQMHHFDDEHDSFHYPRLPARTRSTPTVRPSYSRPVHHPGPLRSAGTIVRDNSSSELGSRGSFDQIVTPRQMLQRDISRMSLLDDLSATSTASAQPYATARRDNPKPISGNMLQGLMRPLRPGDPLQALHVPPRLPYVSNVSTSAATARLPKLVTAQPDGSPLRRPMHNSSYARGASSPVSPLSPVEDEVEKPDDEDLSPVSPDMPAPKDYFVRALNHGLRRDRGDGMKTYGQQDSAAPYQQSDFTSGKQVRLAEHLGAMRTQLETHLRLLDKARQRTLEVQAARNSHRSPKSTGASVNLDGHSRPPSSDSKHDSVLSGIRDSIQSGQKGLPQHRSFWSFTPEDVKINETRKRIEAGRDRRWARTRFDGTKYEMLAETALAEV